MILFVAGLFIISLVVALWSSYKQMLIERYIAEQSIISSRFSLLKRRHEAYHQSAPANAAFLFFSSLLGIDESENAYEDDVFFSIIFQEHLSSLDQVIAPEMMDLVADYERLCVQTGLSLSLSSMLFSLKYLTEKSLHSNYSRLRDLAKLREYGRI